MKNQLKLVLLIGALALSTLPMAACGGPECGDGTTDNDGTCVPNEDSGEVTEGNSCGAGTVDENGVCVPSDEDVTCGPKTKLDDSGRCVISPEACETGKTLDPNTGNCVAGTAECGTGTALDGATGTCVPTADVCDDGTVFDEASGLCLSTYTCSLGDVVVDGVCASPADELASNADVSETENNDPALGGTAQALTVKAAGSSTVFTGTIGAPEDLDADDVLDQDIDVFSFDASAGDWFEVSVQSLGLPSPLFTVEGPNGYFRVSPAIAGAGSARQIVIPADGTYSIGVRPLSSAYSEFPIGGDDWGYVGSLAQIDAPTPTDVSLSTDGISGVYGSLSDQYYNLSGFSAGDLVSVTADASGDGASGILSFWESATDFAGEAAISEGETVDLVVPASGTLLAVIDYDLLEATGVTFELSGELASNFEGLGTLDDDSTNTSTPVSLADEATFSYTFSVSAGQLIEISHDNAQGTSVYTTLTDASGNELLSSSLATAGTGVRYWYSEMGGTYVLNLDNDTYSSGDLTNVAATVTTSTPHDLGAVDVGDSIAESIATPLAKGLSDFYVVTANTPVSISGDITSENDEDIDVYFLEASNEQIESFVTGGSEEFTGLVVPAGTFLIQVKAYVAIPSYAINLMFADAPSMEVEPNGTDATATPFDLSKDLLGTSTDETDVDIYSFSPDADMAADGVLVLKLAQDGYGSDEYVCTLRDSNGDEVGVIYPESVEKGCVALASGLMASETYYFETSRSSSTSEQDYILSASLETGLIEVEPNETDAQATSFELADLIAGASLFGYLPTDTDVDYFSFVLAADQPADQIITLSAASIGPNPTTGAGWKILDSNSTEVASAGIGNDLVVTGLAQGTYYVELTRTSSTTSYSAAYQITAVETAAVCGDDVTEGGESCDGETYCTSACELEAGYQSLTNNQSQDFTETNSPFDVSVTAAQCDSVASISVDVDFPGSTWQDELTLTLTSPAGTSLVLHDEAVGPTVQGLVGNYPDTLTPHGGTLDSFLGEDGTGEWVLAVDYDYFNTATYTSFTLSLLCD